jgi:orotate phosphoribosyltransferase
LPNDVFPINAGSALRLTLTDLLACGSELVGFASLLTLGDAASRLAAQHGVPFFSLISLERNIWMPGACPLCASNVPLIDNFNLAEPV